jgi:hypothetical protein
MPTVARGMSRSDLANLVAQAEEFDDASDTVVSAAPDMSDQQPTPSAKPNLNLNKTLTNADSPVAMQNPNNAPTPVVSPAAYAQRPAAVPVPQGPSPDHGSVPPSSGFRPLPPAAQGTRETSSTTQQRRRAVPTLVIAAGATLLGLLAFVLVLFTLSHFSSPSKTTAAPPQGDPFASARASAITAIAPPPAASESVPAPPTDPAAASAEAAKSAVANGAPPKGGTRAATAAGGAYGTLKVVCNPKCTQVVDNDVVLGPSPIVKQDATVGPHRIRLSWGDATKVVSTIVQSGQTAIVGENHP